MDQLSVDQPVSVTGALARRVERDGDRKALSSPDTAVSLTWAQVDHGARCLATSFREQGVGPGDNVGLLLTNRVEFFLADLAILMLGASPVSIYATSAPEQIAYIVDDAAIELIITETALAGVLADVACKALVVDDPSETGLLARPPLEKVHECTGRDVATIIYTSGTTGPPKGVELTHAAILNAVGAMARRTGLGARGSVVSWLPMAHIAERCASYYAAVVWGCHVTLCPDAAQIFHVLEQARPTWFFAVPRIWEKLQALVEARIDMLPNMQRDTVLRCLGESIERTRNQSTHQRPPHAIDDSNTYQQFADLREAVGLDQILCAQVGAAPSNPDTLVFFRAIGVPITEIYGQSETVVTCAPDPRRPFKIGAVGPPLPGVDLTLAADNEILVRGQLMMRGYHNLPMVTANSFTPDGYFRTGDIGRIDEDGDLFIIDRKKDIIITAGGKNLAPSNIEAAVKVGSPLIDHVMAVGDRRPYVVALIIVDPESGLAADVEGEVADAVRQANSRLASVEQVKRYAIIEDRWLPGAEELTPTMKLKRKAITAKYDWIIESLYAADSATTQIRYSKPTSDETQVSLSTKEK